MPTTWSFPSPSTWTRAVDSPQRDLLIIDGKPMRSRKSIRTRCASPCRGPMRPPSDFSTAWRCCPSTCSRSPISEGKFAQTWSLECAASRDRRTRTVSPEAVRARPADCVWNAILITGRSDRENHRLPYLDELVFLFVGTEDAQVMRFEAGETRHRSAASVPRTTTCWRVSVIVPRCATCRPGTEPRIQLRRLQPERSERRKSWTTLRKSRHGFAS